MSIKDFWQNAIKYRLAGGHAADHAAMGLVPFAPSPTHVRADSIGNSIVAAVNNAMKFGCLASGGRLWFGANLGVSGNNSSQILARINTVSDAARVVFYEEGTNDATLGITYATHAANTLASFRALMARNKTPVMLLAPPKNSNTAAVESMNLIDWYLSTQKLGVPCIAPWDQFVDVTNGAYANGTTYSPDGIHPSELAHMIAGDAIWAAFSSGTPYVPLPRSNIGGVNAALVASNPLCLTDTNSDGIPDGWNKAGTGTISLVSDGLKGNWIKTSQSAASTAIAAYRDVTGYSVGDELLFVCRAKIENASNAKADLGIFLNNSTAATRYYAWQGVTENCTERLVIVRGVVDAGTTSVRLIAQVSSLSGAAFTADLSIAQAQVYNLTQLAALAN